MSTAQSTPDVTHAELVTNVRYGYWFNHLCERLYARLDLALNAIQLVGGSAAAVVAFQATPLWSSIAGLVLAVVAAIALLVQPAIKAERHRRAKCQYLDLESKAWKLSFDDLGTQLMEVRKDAPTGVDALAVPAYNATLRAIGHSSDFIAETKMQRFARALA